METGSLTCGLNVFEKGRRGKVRAEKVLVTATKAEMYLQYLRNKDLVSGANEN